jgi:hypothetical protein
MSAQSVIESKEAKSSHDLATKLKIIRNVEADRRHYKRSLTTMKKSRIQPITNYFFKKMDDSQSSTSAHKIFSIRLLNITYSPKI